MTAPRIVGETVVYKGWNRFMLVEVTTRTGAAITRTVEDHGTAVAVLPFDPARRLAMLVRQLRVPVLLAHGLDTLLEAPAGILDEPDPADCARREAMEETGLRLGALLPVGRVFTAPGSSTEAIVLFLAEYGTADRVAAGGGLAAETEEIEAVEMPLDRLAAMAEAGEVPDLKTLALVQALRLRRPELFEPAAGMTGPAQA